MADEAGVIRELIAILETRKKTSQITTLKEQRINVLRIENKEFISLTDLARYANPEEPKIPIYAWMRPKIIFFFQFTFFYFFSA